jgi:two-component system, OmpR family, alkaline phosphatase synthesis response regulator PhoP
VHGKQDGDEEAWAAFDAALRDLESPGGEPDPSLRNGCLAAIGSAGLRACRILAVDDEPNIRRLIQVHLSRAGYQVAAAGDGAEALAQVRSRPPDLIILDVMMPGLTGLQVLEALKDDPETAAIPVIMLTAKGDDDHIRQASRTGADVYMTKPFNPEELRTVVERMAAVLGTPENPPPLRRWLK